MGNRPELLSVCDRLDAALEAETGWMVDDLRTDNWTHIRLLAANAREVALRATD